jgi:hypothetical protein
MMRKFIIAPLAKYYYCDQMEAKERGRAWERSACKVLVGKPEGKKPLGKLRHR